MHSDSQENPAGNLPPTARFRTTQWNVILDMHVEDEAQRHHALEQLCRTYWYPVYAFVRRLGHPQPDAQDLAQGFFAHMLERDAFTQADQRKGRFRSFLLGSVKNFLLNEKRKNSRLKRGGQSEIVPMDEIDAEERYQRELAHDSTPERIYLRSWADALLAATLQLLQSEYEQAGRRQLFSALAPYLAGATENPSYQNLSQNLGLSVGAITTSIYRMRKRYGEILRDQIAQTLSDQSEVDDEISFLFSAME